MTKKPEYDSIAGDYSKSTQSRDDRAAVLVPSAKALLGELSDKTVLDLACGDGYFSRLIKTWGANKVIGVDVSAKMIELAKSKELDLRQGIEYLEADISEMPQFGKFDVIFAGFLLHYAPSIEALSSMATCISNNLKSDGKFVTFNENPEMPLHTGIKYGVETLSEKSLANGSKITRIHYSTDQKQFEFSHYHYNKATYEKALLGADFKEIVWQKFTLAASIEDKSYWDEYVSNFSIRPLTAYK